MQAAIFGVIRHVLTAAGGGLVANGMLGSSDLEAGVGAVMVLAGLVASVLNKRKQLEGSVKVPPRGIYVLPLLLALGVTAAACDGRQSPIQPEGNPPVISLFTADSPRVTAGGTATLRWEVIDKDAQVRIDPAPGNVPSVGSYTFAPTSIGTYNFTLTARNANGTTQRFITITYGTF